MWFCLVILISVFLIFEKNVSVASNEINLKSDVYKKETRS